jgi:replicative DNA helicase
MAKDIISSAQTSLDEVALGMTDSNEIVDIADYFDEYAESVEEGVKRYRDSGGNPLAATNGVPTGFKTLDKYVGGWQPGSLITLGGRTGTGKSFTATNFLVAAANAGRSIMFFSLEMAAQEIMNRIMAMTAHVKLAPLTKGALNDADVEKVKQAREHFKKLKISIDTTSNMDVNHIKAAAMKKMMSDDGLDLIIVDYLQLITPDPTRKNDNRERQVAEISRALKLLAGQLKVPIIDLVQLNREKKDDEDPTPTINDIRESGAIAQNSNVIILIHRNIKSDDGKEPTLFIIGKNRGNRCGIKFKCHTMLSYGQFLEMDDDGTAFDDDGNTDDQSTSDNGDYVSDDPDKIDEWINDESESSEIGGYDDFDSFGA